MHFQALLCICRTRKNCIPFSKCRPNMFWKKQQKLTNEQCITPANASQPEKKRKTIERRHRRMHSKFVIILKATTTKNNVQIRRLNNNRIYMTELRQPAAKYKIVISSTKNIRMLSHVTHEECGKFLSLHTHFNCVLWIFLLLFLLWPYSHICIQK